VKSLIFSLATLFLFSHSAWASFDFSPVIATLAPSGQGASFSFNVTNSDDAKIPVQISIFAREPDLDGNEQYKENDKIDEQFRIFPDQVVLNPHETRNIRVTWTGNPKPNAEIPFRIIAEELPIDIADPTKVYTKPVARVSISTRYVASLYINPQGTKPEIEVEAKRSEAVTKDMILTVTNKGTSHQVIKQPIVKLKTLGGAKEIIMSGEDVKPLVNQNILPGRSRRFTLTWPKDLPPGPVKASLEIPKE
jgi:fimbrial chaperone protein